MPNYILKSDGTKEEFNSVKIANSLRRVGASDNTIEHILDKITQKKRVDESTENIYREVYSHLEKKEHTAAMKYSVRRAIFDLGPDGFPFEKFVAEIFKYWGYETITGQILLGSCVEHEIDVVAWKKNEGSLAMSEVKFHNDIGLKSDLKVALYVKARFDDLSSNDYFYGGKKRKLTEKYLFTNTKFSTTAIKYAECQNIKMISWNYPSNNNLFKIVEESKLYPITSLTKLNTMHKKELIRGGIITCKSLKENISILKEIGIKSEEFDGINPELSSLMADF